eukprot:c5006_g1_i1 orf=133-975(+)
MDSVDGRSEGDYLEAQLLTDPVAQIEYEESAEGGKILHTATFADLERRFLNYETLQWIVISLLLILAWGVGVILLLYTPIRRYIMQRDFRSRQLYVTSEAIVYKVARPAFLPWLGVSKFEKCILLPLITDIVLEQGCLQSLFGLYSIRIETLGQGPLEACSISVCGMTNPRQFRKVVLIASNTVKNDATRTPNRKGNVILGLSCQGGYRSPSFASPRAMIDTPQQTLSPSGHNRHLFTYGDQVLQKIEDIRINAKKIEMLISRQQGKASETLSDVSEPEC